MKDLLSHTFLLYNDRQFISDYVQKILQVACLEVLEEASQIIDYFNEERLDEVQDSSTNATPEFMKDILYADEKADERIKADTLIDKELAGLDTTRTAKTKGEISKIARTIDQLRSENMPLKMRLTRL